MLPSSVVVKLVIPLHFVDWTAWVDAGKALVLVKYVHNS